MLSIDINLDPLGNVSARKPLVTVAIWNDVTGDHTHGNYRYAISHQHDSVFGDRAWEATGIDHPTAHDLIGLSGRPWVWKTGAVTGYRRQRGAAGLVATVLKDARV